jgi:four helix bundle protein
VFDCLETAHQAIEALVPLIRAVGARSRSLADQLERASVSIASNIDEGRSATDKQRLHYYRTAYGSAREVGTQLRIARAFGYVDDIAVANELLDRVRAMLWRLTH